MFLPPIIPSPSTIIRLLLAVTPLTNAATLDRRWENWSSDCSSDSNPSVTPTDFSTLETWKTQMLSCLQLLNTTSWDGNLCQPVTYPFPPSTPEEPPHLILPTQVPNNSIPTTSPVPLGPAWLFWKGEENHNSEEDALSCWKQCRECLADGILAGKAVTTSCWRRSYGINYGPAIKWSCNMGFEWKG